MILHSGVSACNTRLCGRLTLGADADSVHHASQDAPRPRKGPSPPVMEEAGIHDLLSARRADAGVAKGDLMSNPASSLPARPSLEQLRTQAKDLLKGYHAGARIAVERFHAHHPRSFSAKRVALADAQLVLAREYGFPSWAKLKHHVESLQRPADFDEPLWGRDTWPFLASVYRGDEVAVRQMLASDPSLARVEYAYLQPLHYAVRGGRIEMVRLLLDAGADPLAEGWSGKFGDEIRDDTPLARARDRDLDEIATLLEVAAGSKPRSISAERKAPSTPERELEDEMMRICHRGDVAAALDHLECSSDIAPMADPHHFVFQLALRRRWRGSLRAYRARRAASGRLEKNHDLIELTIARAGERRVIANLIPKFSGPAFRQWICASVEHKSHHLNPTAAHRVV